jgi:hypothetical protein
VCVCVCVCVCENCDHHIYSRCRCQSRHASSLESIASCMRMVKHTYTYPRLCLNVYLSSIHFTARMHGTTLFGNEHSILINASLARCETHIHLFIHEYMRTYIIHAYPSTDTIFCTQHTHTHTRYLVNTTASTYQDIEKNLSNTINALFVPFHGHMTFSAMWRL